LAPIAAAGLTTPIPVSSSNGFIGGGQVGYNYQFGNFVAGIETDIQGLSGRGSGATATSLPSVVSGDRINTTVTATNSVKWLGTLRGQLGFTMTPRLLVYGTGGLAYGDVTSSTTIGQQIVGAVAVA
jgi:outer membrane immunogenic protein